MIISLTYVDISMNTFYLNLLLVANYWLSPLKQQHKPERKKKKKLIILLFTAMIFLLYFIKLLDKIKLPGLVVVY